MATLTSTSTARPVNKPLKKWTFNLDGGGGAANLHSPQEWFQPEGSAKGVQKLLLTVLAWDGGNH